MVAAAIVVLFSVPVVTLIGSGTENYSAGVGGALQGETVASRQGTQSTLGGNMGDDPYSAPSQPEQATPVTLPASGRNKGVGFDVSETVSAGSDRGISIERPGFSLRDGDSAGGGRSGTSGSGGGASSGRQASAPNPDDDTGGTTERDIKRTLLAIGVPALKPGEDIAEEEPKRTVDEAELRTSPSNTVTPQPNTVTNENCFPVDAAEGTTATADGPATDAGEDRTFDQRQIRTLLDREQFRILDEEDTLPSINCAQRRVVTAAADQLGDGTILGAVTISSSSDHHPGIQAAPPTAPELQLPVTASAARAPEDEEVEAEITAVDAEEVGDSAPLSVAANTSDEVLDELPEVASRDVAGRPEAAGTATQAPVIPDSERDADVMPILATKASAGSGASGNATAKMALMPSPPERQRGTQILRSGR